MYLPDIPAYVLNNRTGTTTKKRRRLVWKFMYFGGCQLLFTSLVNVCPHRVVYCCNYRNEIARIDIDN